MENIILDSAKEEDFPYIREKIKRYLLDGRRLSIRQFIVARLEEKVVGFIRIVEYRQFREVRSLGVDYYHRRKGIGGELLMRCIEIAKAKDKEKPLFGITHRPDFISKFGFVKADRFPKELQDKIEKVCVLDRSKISVMVYEGRTPE